MNKFLCLGQIKQRKQDKQALNVPHLFTVYVCGNGGGKFSKCIKRDLEAIRTKNEKSFVVYLWSFNFI